MAKRTTKDRIGTPVERLNDNARLYALLNEAERILRKYDLLDGSCQNCIFELRSEGCNIAVRAADDAALEMEPVEL